MHDILFFLLQCLFELIFGALGEIILALLRITGRIVDWCGTWAWETGRRQMQAYQQRRDEWHLHVQQPQWSLLRAADTPPTAELLRPAACTKPMEDKDLLRTNQL